MKNQVSAIIALAVLVVGVTACSGDAPDDAGSAGPTPSSHSTVPAMSATASSAADSVKSSAPSGAATLTRQGDQLTDIDKDANIVPNSGVRLTVTPGATGKAVFQLIDPASGTDYQDHFTFDLATKTFVKHKVSTAMGKTYDYTVDLNTNKLVTIVGNGEDVTQSTKDRGRFDKAEAEALTAKKACESWFQSRYGMPLSQTMAG